MDTNVLSFAVISFLAAGITTYFICRKPFKSSLPPGPPGLPILGNVLDISTTEPWVSFKRFGEKYGDIVHIRVLTQDVIILNSLEAIRDLFEQRSHNYSSRPYFPGNDMLDAGWGTGFMTNGDEWRTHRKIFHQALRAEAISSYHPMLSMKIRDLLKSFNDCPAAFKQHIRTYSTAVAMAVTFDYHPAARSDPMVENLKRLDDILSAVFSPGLSAIFAALPFLMYIPPWVPGAAWQRTAREGRKLMNWWFTYPIQYVKDKMAAGPIAPCIVGDALSRLDESQADATFIMRAIKGAAGSSLIAASDTTDATLQIFLLAMVLYPDVQKRARDEILAVVGTGRFPNLGDRSNLPYIDAVLRETLRWHQATPFSLARTLVNNDIYRGYGIPKGVMILPNVWGIAHDETKYLDPFTFDPNRFFDDQGKLNDDTMSYVFGFGRRICAGRLLADASLWVAMANLLAAFSFDRPLDEMGRPVKIERRFTAGVASRPDPLPVRISLHMEAQKFASLWRMDD